jgi:hypothetical protein
VGGSTGRQTLYINRHRTASSLVKDWQGESESTLDVPVTTLDDTISKLGVPQHCKIDVEGYELEVLKGLSQAIPTPSFEYHLRNNGTARAIASLNYLSAFGDLLVNITHPNNLFLRGRRGGAKASSSTVSARRTTDERIQLR